MEITILLIPMAILLGLVFIAGFVWMAKTGQYDDLETPKYKILIDDKIEEKKL